MSDPNRTAPPRRGARRLVLLALPVLLISGAASLNLVGQAEVAVQPAETVFEGTSEPSKDVELAFPVPGRVAEVMVRNGDVVEVDAVLMRQDTRMDEAQLRALEAKADIVARVQLAQTQEEQAKVELERFERLGQINASQKVELERARLEVVAAATRIIEEERQGTVAVAEADQQRIIIEQKTMTSPESGVIQTVEASVGEIFGPQTPALRLVKIDPLHVYVQEAPSQIVRRLKVGDAVQVRYLDEEQWLDAKVIFIDPVGISQASEDKLPFRLEMANAEGRPAGARLQVRLQGGQRQAAR